MCPAPLAAADEAIAIVTRIRVKSANPEWRARFLFRAIRALRGADRRGTCQRRTTAPYGVRSAPPRKCAPDRSPTSSRWARLARSGRRSAGGRAARAADLAAVAPGSAHPAAGCRRSRNASRCATPSRRRARNSTPFASARAESPRGRPRFPESLAQVQRQLPPRHGGARVFRRRQQLARLAADAQRAASCRSPGPRAGCSEPSARWQRGDAGGPAAPRTRPGFDVVRTSARRHSRNPHAGAGRRPAQQRAVRVAARAGRWRRTARRSIRTRVCAVAGARDGKRPAGEVAQHARRRGVRPGLRRRRSPAARRQERRLRHACAVRRRPRPTT